MRKICYGMELCYQKMADAQDTIGLRRFLGGMVVRHMRIVQETYTLVEGSNITPEEWTSRLIIKLMEITHGQWLYCCVQVHDSISDTKTTAHKEALQQEIEAELEMGMEKLLDKDQYLCEFNLEDLENTLGERQEYWLIAIRAARKATTLQGNQHNSACSRAHPRREEG